MQIIADLHLHGPYSRGTSWNLSIQNLEKYARIKGLDLLGTGDFTHPRWLEDIRKSLSEDGTGVLRTESGFSFVLSSEVANIYDQDGRNRKVHNIILAPDIATVEQINHFLSSRGSLSSDGRPIFSGMPCPELVENLMSISNRIVVIPAHVWTPWFSLFGSNSGFDSVKECFGDQTRHIFALETGLSSDPAMNWRLSDLDRYSLVSNSDSHSHWPWRIGREANVFDLKKPDYASLISAIREKDPKRYLYTIETDPAYGKYHLDGHRACSTRLEPAEAVRIGNTCPVCRRKLTIGVLHRVEELADRPAGFVPQGAIPFRKLLPLTEIISAVTGIEQLYSKSIWDIYNRLVKEFGSEFSVLLSAGREALKKVAGEKIAELILGVREERVDISPGYDGVYGKLLMGKAESEKARRMNPQSSLNGFINR